MTSQCGGTAQKGPYSPTVHSTLLVILTLLQTCVSFGLLIGHVNECGVPQIMVDHLRQLTGRVVAVVGIAHLDGIEARWKL